MMKNTVVLVLIISVVCFRAFCQDYEVLEVKRSFKETGEKIKKGDFLNRKEIVLIREKGYMTLDIDTPINLQLAPGKHDIDLLSTQLATRYKKHESLEAMLKDQGILECKFVYQVWLVPGTTRHYEADRITVQEEHLSVNLRAQEPVTLHWKNPDKKYHGSYLLIIKDAFSKLFVDVLEANESSITFHPEKYGHHHMLYHIVAEDCRASRTFRIEVKR